MSAFRLGLTLMFVLCAVVSCLDFDNESTRNLIIRQFLDKYQPTLLVHPAVRRFRRRFDYVNVSSTNKILNKDNGFSEFRC